MEKIKKNIKSNEVMHYYAKKVHNYYCKLQLRLIDDESYLKNQYYRKTKKTLNINEPKLYNEKIQFLKLHYKNPILNVCVDKAEVREYVKRVIGSEILIDCLGVYDNIEDIDFTKLPNDFILKLTNGSGANIICTDKFNLNVKKIKRRFAGWQKCDFFAIGREWAYKNLKNRIICEKLIKPKNGTALNDYRFFCFNGEPKFISVDLDSVIDGRKSYQYYRNLYDTEWNIIDATIQYPNKPDAIIGKPKHLFEMIDIAKKLSQGFPHVRVDLYYVDEKIYFGELTFYHASGYQKILPESFEKQMGDWIDINNIKH